MHIHSLTLREIHLPLFTPFETSMDRVRERRIILAEVNVDGVSGWGECTAGENPFYAPEDTETCWHILKDYLWPMLKGRELISAACVWPLLEPFADTTWPKPPLRRRFGTLKPVSKIVRCGNSWAESKLKSPAAFQSASKTPSMNSPPPCKRNWPPATNASRSK